RILPTFKAMKATVDNLEVVGIDFMTIQTEGVTLKYNKGSNWKGSKTVAPWIDFSTSGANGGIEVATGGDPIILDYKDPILGLNVDKATLIIDNFIYVQGGFSFEKGARKRVTVDTGVTRLTAPSVNTILTQLELKSDAEVSLDGSQITNLEVETTTFGMSAVDIYVGYGTPDFDTPFENQNELFGFGVKDVNLALAMMKTTADVKNFPTFMALKADAGEFAFFTGDSDFFKLQGQAISVELNTGSKWAGSTAAPTVNFLESFAAIGDTPAGLEVIAGTTSLFIDLVGPVIGVGVTDALIQLDGFIHISGNFAFRKGDVKTYDINTSLTTIEDVQLEAMTVGMTNVKVFVGFNG
ncbi:hypothetical protein MJH12_12280, partial [bacterium]|nr:hypothetical protein [bacterium]